MKRNIVREGRKMGWGRQVAAYVRVSSRAQTLAMQQDAIKRAARARGDRIARWFAEKESAVRIDRGQLSNLREAIRFGLVTKLYVYRLDRLSRSGIRDTLAILEEFRNAGCRVVTVADGFTLEEGPTADVVIAVMAWAAQQERAAIGERIAAARQRIEAAGGTWGRPRRVSEHVVKLIRWLRREGKTIREIAVKIKVPRATISDVLSEKGPYAQGQKPRAKKQ